MLLTFLSQSSTGEEWDEWVAEGKKSPFLGPYVPSDPEATFTHLQAETQRIIFGVPAEGAPS